MQARDGQTRPQARPGESGPRSDPTPGRVSSELLERVERLVAEHGGRRVAFALRLYARRRQASLGEHPAGRRQLALLGRKGPAFRNASRAERAV